MIKIADLYNFRVKGYDPLKLFSVNKARGRKRKQRNPLDESKMNNFDTFYYFFLINYMLEIIYYMYQIKIYTALSKKAFFLLYFI